MKLLHFSDLHLQANLPRGLSWLLDKRVLGTFTQHVRRARKQDLTTIPKLLELARQEQPDAIVCTGDLSAVAMPEEFQRAREALTPFKELVPPGNFIFIPGNHDRYIDRTDAREALQRIASYLNSPHDVDFSVSQRKLEQVSCYLLDAARPRPLWSSGGVAEANQLGQLQQLTEHTPPKGELRILVSHFPLLDCHGRRLPCRRRMQGDIQLRNILAQNHFGALLCGHIHTPFVCQLDGAMQVCPGSLTLHHQAAIMDTTTETFSVRLVDVLNGQQRRFTATINP